MAAPYSHDRDMMRNAQSEVVMNTNMHYQPKRHIAIIESARGFAALYVLMMHVVILLGLPTSLAEGSYSKLIIDLFLLYGHQAVLLFFVLSGFSIHYASVDRPLQQKQGILHYYYLRWRRIYPIFFLAVIISLSLDVLGSALAINTYPQDIHTLSWQQLLSTFGFLTDRTYVDGILQPVLNSNGPLWSLSYEVFYYLLYPVYWQINKRYGITGCIAFGTILSITSFTLGKLAGAQHFLNVLDLYVIWCLGAVLAEMHRRQISTKLPIAIHALIIYILLQSTWVLENVTYTVGAFFEISWGLFFFFVMLLYLGNQGIEQIKPAHKAAILVAAGLGYLVIIAGVEKLHLVSHQTLFYSRISLTLIMFALGLYISQLNIQSLGNLLLKPVYHFGKSSYGIYVIHYPMLLFLTLALPHYGIPVWWGILFVPAILYTAYVIELRYQPLMIGIMDPLAVHAGIMRPAREKK